MERENTDEWSLLSNDNLFGSWLSHVGLNNLLALDYYYQSNQTKIWNTVSVDTSDKQKFAKKLIKIQFRVIVDSDGARENQEI